MDLPRHEGRRGLPRPRDEQGPGGDGPRRDGAHDAGGRVAPADRGDRRVHHRPRLARRDAPRQRRLAGGRAIPVGRRRGRLRRDARALALLLRDESRGTEAPARRYSARDHEPRAVQSERAGATVLDLPEDGRSVDVQSGRRGILLHRRGQGARAGPRREFADRGRRERHRHGAVHAGGPGERSDRCGGAGGAVRRALRGGKAAVAGRRGVRGGARGVPRRGVVPLWRRCVTGGVGGASGRVGDQRVGDVPRARSVRRDAEGVPQRGCARVAESSRGRAADGAGGDGERVGSRDERSESSE